MTSYAGIDGCDRIIRLCPSPEPSPMPPRTASIPPTRRAALQPPVSPAPTAWSPVGILHAGTRGRNGTSEPAGSPRAASRARPNPSHRHARSSPGNQRRTPEPGAAPRTSEPRRQVGMIQPDGLPRTFEPKRPACGQADRQHRAACRRGLPLRPRDPAGRFEVGHRRDTTCRPTC